jgi:hypothetical protein
MIERARGTSAENGFAMAALLVAMAAMAIAMTVAMPVWRTTSQREKEAELVFRGEQYARALALFQRRFPGATPPDIDTLVNLRLLRKKYKDPMTGDDFQVLGAGDALVQQAQAAQATVAAQASAAAARGQGTPGSSPTTAGIGSVGTSQSSSTGSNLTANRFSLGQTTSGGGGFSTGSPTVGTPPGGSPFSGNTGIGTSTARGPGTTAGGVVGVVSKSKDTSFRLYNGRNHYNEWVFMATQQTLRAGAGARGGAAGAGRGAAQPGAPNTPGGRGAPAPIGGRGNFGSPSTPFPGAPPSTSPLR